MPGRHAAPFKAFAGQASTQRLQRPQKFFSIAGPQGSPRSVKTVPKRTHDPNGRVMS
jgi:hypothetical protein